MREWIKALPVAVGLPVVIGASSVRPEDAASNLAAWAHLLGFSQVPDWLASPAADHQVIIAAIASGCIYGFAVWGIPIYRHFSSPSKKKTLPTPTPATTQQQSAPAPVVRELTPLQRYVIDGLTSARDDLASIEKHELSRDALNSWQARADRATRLAHANGVSVHNPIGHHLSACQGDMDTDMLDAVRGGIIDLLNRGIAATKAGG